MNLILWGSDNEVNFEAAFDDHQNTWKCSWNMFWVIWRTFKCDLIMVELLISSSFLWASFIVQLFDFLKIDISYITGNSGHFFDILTFDFLHKPPQPWHRVIFVFLVNCTWPVMSFHSTYLVSIFSLILLSPK